MILNSFCIIVLSAAILMNSFTQSCHTKSIRALNDKLADLRLRFNSSRGKEEEIHAEKIRKENKDWCQEDSKIFEQNYLVCSPHASKLCSYLTDTEKGILMSVIRCCVDNSSGNDGYYFVSPMKATSPASLTVMFLIRICKMPLRTYKINIFGMRRTESLGFSGY